MIAAPEPEGEASAESSVPVQVDGEEAALVARVQRGDTDAFDALARRYAPRALAIALRLLRHRQDAEDLVQEAFLAALAGIDGFDVSRPFAPWFFRIVVNRGLNARKSRGLLDRRIRAAELTPEDAQSTQAAEAPAEQAEIRARFAAALGELTERQQQVVQLADIGGHTSDEIGEMLHLPSGTVRWHLHQARRALRASLAPLHDGEMRVAI